jgi:hypothetical protein
MTLDENLIHRMTLRFVSAINKVKEEKFRDVSDFFQMLKQNSKDKRIIAIFEKIELEVSDKLAQIINSITVKAIGHLSQLREEMIQKGIDLNQIEKIPPKEPDVMKIQKAETSNKIKEEIARRNRILTELITAVPQFKILSIIEKTKANTYDVLYKATGYSLTTIRNYVQELEDDGFVSIDKSRKPYLIEIERTPW